MVAPTELSVLILGESGTGKENLARELHQYSKRADKPFVAVDCGSLSVALTYSAFFGHEKGAFTGADAAETGFLQEANGGTLFLDEVGNSPIETQQMLLRAIQEKKCRPMELGNIREYYYPLSLKTNKNEEKKRIIQAIEYACGNYRVAAYLLEVSVPALCHLKIGSSTQSPYLKGIRRLF